MILRMQLAVCASLLSFLAVLLSCSVHAGEPLTLDQYLAQVGDKNQGLKSANATATGSLERSHEGALLLAPTLFGDLHYYDDKSIKDAPSFQGDRTSFRAFQLGLSQLTTFGLEGRLSYTVQHTQIYDSAPGFVLQPDFFQAYPKIELTQSLWKNMFGIATRANQQMIEAQALGLSYSQRYQAKVEVANAEIAYWNLALAREQKEVARNSLDRAGRIRDWQARRVKLGLGDKSDRLQAEAALELRRLDFQAATDDERTAGRAFNAAREIDADEVHESIATPASEDVEKLSAPARAPLRDDVRAAAETDRATEANAELSLQTLSPDLEIYGSYAFNGRDVNSNSTLSESFQNNHPTWLAGLRFTAPLDLPLILRSRAGHKLERAATATHLERKLFEQETEWKELERKLAEAKRRLELARLIEVTQRDKLANEKERFQQGRTTTYQVLTFEQDYATASLARIHSEGDVLRVRAQMRIYTQ